MRLGARGRGVRIRNEYTADGEKVHPSTGYIKAEVNGKTILDKKSAPIWKKSGMSTRAEVLPDCRRYIEEKNGRNRCGGDAAVLPRTENGHYGKRAGRADRFREDLISSLDALHEDMYFCGR